MLTTIAHVESAVARELRALDAQRLQIEQKQATLREALDQKDWARLEPLIGPIKEGLK